MLFVGLLSTCLGCSGRLVRVCSRMRETLLFSLVANVQRVSLVLLIVVTCMGCCQLG